MRHYTVTEFTADDPDSIRPLIMNEDEIHDTYPHWGGKSTIVSREGWVVTIEPSMESN